MYYEKLNLFFKNKGLKQKEVAEILDHNSNMISKYLTGKSDFNGEFIKKLTEKFPDIDLNEIFANDEESPLMLQEEGESYNYNVINEIEKVESILSKMKSEMARKSHDKR